MKINPTHDKSVGSVASPVTTRVSSDATDAKPVGKVDATAAAPSATVTLSSAAVKLLSDSDPTFDAQKVAQVKQSIEDGTYKVNAEAIADKLLSNARELLGRVQGN